MVTHDLAVAESCARTIHIRDGTVSCEDVPPMILLRLISWPYARKHLLRCLLTIAGHRAGRGGVRRHAHGESKRAGGVSARPSTASPGSTQLQVSAGEPGFDEDVLDKVQKLPGSARRRAGDRSDGVRSARRNLLILGVDMLGDRNLRSYDLEDTDEAIDDPLVFLAQPDSLIVTKTFADQNMG